MDTSDFKNIVYKLIAQIPKGRVMTYGDIAILCGHPRAARIVGTIAHFGPEDLPWHRVVNRFGGLASGYWGGREAHRAMLEAEGVIIGDDFVIKNFEEVKWIPPQYRRS
jgi:methylated-DNA-protein-cysteine methyltransferase related protein